MLQTRNIAFTLKNLRRGERAWFWFCQDTDAVELPLVVVPLEQDPSAAFLTEIVDNIERPSGAVQCVGLAHCDEDGRMHLGSGSAQEGTLPALARWVKAHLHDAPGLARLVNARVLQYDQDRVVTGIWEDGRLWEGVAPLRPTADGVSAAAALAALAPGQGAWFWMTASGPGDMPDLVLMPDHEHSAEDFARAVDALRRRSPRGASAAAGMLQVLKTGKLVLSTADDVTLCRTIAAALAARADLARLDSCVILKKGGQAFTDGTVLAAVDVASSAAAVAALSDDTMVFFLIRHDAAISVRVSSDEQAIRDAASEDAAGRVSHGQLLLSDDGRIILYASEGYPGALADLASWVRYYYADYPELLNLSDSIFVLGEETTEDAALWSFLAAGGAL